MKQETIIKYNDKIGNSHTITVRNVLGLNIEYPIQIIHEIWNGKRNKIQTLDIPAEFTVGFIEAVTNPIT